MRLFVLYAVVCRFAGLAQVLRGCNQMFREPNGSFSSPLYPDPYPGNISCTYIIFVQKEKIINLTLSDFNVGTDNGTRSCIGDRLEVSGQGIHCGTLHDSETILSIDNTMSIHFVSIENSTSRRYTGFTASYRAVDWKHDPHPTVLNPHGNNGLFRKHPTVVYKISLATTVVMGIIIGVLVFIVVILSSLLVRQRSTKFRRKVLRDQNSNANEMPAEQDAIGHVTTNGEVPKGKSGADKDSIDGQIGKSESESQNGRQKRRSRYRQRSYRGLSSGETGHSPGEASQSSRSDSANCVDDENSDANTPQVTCVRGSVRKEKVRTETSKSSDIEGCVAIVHDEDRQTSCKDDRNTPLASSDIVANNDESVRMAAHDAENKAHETNSVSFDGISMGDTINKNTESITDVTKHYEGTNI